MLSFRKGGKAVARVKGGQRDGAYIYLYTVDEMKGGCDTCPEGKRKKLLKGCGMCKKGGCDKCGEEDCMYHGAEDEDSYLGGFITDVINGDYFTKKYGKRISADDKEMLYHSLRTGKRIHGGKMGKLYDDAKADLMNKNMSEIVITDGILVPVPSVDKKEHQRDSIYIAGPTGSGKSTYAAAYIKEYKKMFPMNKIYVFSRLSEDPALDKLGVIRVMIDEKLVEDPIEPKELAGKNGSLVVFDDIDTIPDKKMNESVRKLRDDILETGRKLNIYIISTAHQITNYKQTRTLLNEANSATFFLGGGSNYHIKRFLTVYGGLDKANRDRVINLPSRWATIHLKYPAYILYQTGIYLIDKKASDKKKEKKKEEPEEEEGTITI